MANFILAILCLLFLYSCREFYLSLFDFKKAQLKKRRRLQEYLSSNTAQLLLFELDEMHNEPNFVLQCEQHGLWKKKVRNYVNQFEIPPKDSNVVRFRVPSGK